MRNLWLLLLFVFAGCEAPNQCDELIGSWKLQDLLSSEGLSDKTTFLENDSVYSELLRNDTVVQRLAGTYTLDCKSMQLTIRTGDHAFTHTVLKLNGTELELENKELHRLDRYERY